MQDKTAEMVLGAVAQGAINAEWDCEINRNLNQIIFIKDVPGHEAYEFRIAYGEETPEELIDTISESIDSEIADAEMPDFIETILLEYSGLGMDDGSVYAYADFVSGELQTLSDRIAAAFDQTGLYQIPRMDDEEGEKPAAFPVAERTMVLPPLENMIRKAERACSNMVKEPGQMPDILPSRKDVHDRI